MPERFIVIGLDGQGRIVGGRVEERGLGEVEENWTEARNISWLYRLTTTRKLTVVRVQETSHHLDVRGRPPEDFLHGGILPGHAWQDEVNQLVKPVGDFLRSNGRLVAESTMHRE